MISKGLLVRMEAREGKEGMVEEFLHLSLPYVRQEFNTVAWFAFSSGPREFGIFSAFGDEESRNAHLAGKVVKEFIQEADTLFKSPPAIIKVDIISDKVPARAPEPSDEKGIVLLLDAQEGKGPEMEQFLRVSQEVIEAEEGTTTWFAFRIGPEKFGVFDTFPGHTDRVKHILGKVPRGLLRQSLGLMSGLPDMDLVQVLAEKIKAA